MHISLRNKDMYRITMRRVVKPLQYLEKFKHLDMLDEAFGHMCIHISRDLLFHLDGLKTLNEVCDKIKYLFGKQDELRGYIV